MKRLLLALWLILLLSFSAVAQDEDTVEIQLSGAFYVSIPESWEVESQTGEGYYWNSEDSIIRIRTYSPFTRGFLEDTGVESTLEDLVVGGYEQRELDNDAIETFEIGDYEAISYTFEQNDEGQRFDRSIIMYEQEDGFIVAGNIRPQGEGSVDEDDLENLIAALETVSRSDVFTFYEGTTVEIPEGWVLTHDANSVFARFYAKKDGVEVRMILWPGYGVIAGFENPLDFLPWAYRGAYDDVEPFDADKLESAEIAGFDASYYEFESGNLNENGVYDRELYTFDISNNSNFTVTIVSDNTDDDTDIIFEVLDTLDPGRRFVCPLFADPGIRIRSEPDTNSELVRQTDDETLVAFSTVEDDAGNTWFNVGEGYIRSDVIFYEQNPCDEIPEE
jgi:hypothetical protein